MKLKLFNTETRELEEIIPQDGKTIRMYTCGPTIYDYAHIGNFRTYVFEDLLRRTIQYFGMPVNQTMNITDIDDKTIRGAIAKNIPLKEYTEPYRKAFFEDLENLNIQKAEHYPAATDYISEMIRLIEILLQKECAYKSNGSIYFSIRSFSDYGRLSHLKIEELKANASGENDADEYDKENIADFVLWKAYDETRDGAIFWESPFGRGRPGWHIECSAMAMKLLGSAIDIHCGGIDNMFPHHENEIAQSECCSGVRFVRHWIHVEHLVVDHKKMSKSLGNFYTLRDLMKRGFSGEQVRYLLLSTHYRVQLNFTMQGLDAAKASLQRIEDLIVRLRGINLAGTVYSGRPQTLNLDSARQSKIEAQRSERRRPFSEEKGEEKDRFGEVAASSNSKFEADRSITLELLTLAEERFRTALADDINISAALAALFDLIRDLNTLADANKLTREDAENTLLLLERWDSVLGVLPLQEEPIHEDLVEFLEQRERARKEKNFAVSDQMRQEIFNRGYLIEDTPMGARLKKKGR